MQFCFRRGRLPAKELQPLVLGKLNLFSGSTRSFNMCDTLVSCINRSASFTFFDHNTFLYFYDTKLAFYRTIPNRISVVMSSRSFHRVLKLFVVLPCDFLANIPIPTSSSSYFVPSTITELVDRKNCSNHRST